MYSSSTIISRYIGVPSFFCMRSRQPDFEDRAGSRFGRDDMQAVCRTEVQAQPVMHVQEADADGRCLFLWPLSVLLREEPLELVPNLRRHADAAVRDDDGVRLFAELTRDADIGRLLVVIAVQERVF